MKNLGNWSGPVGGGRDRGQEGSVMVLALVVLTVVMMLAAGLSQFSLRADREVGSRTDAVRAQYLAEAGLSEAIAALRSGFSGAVGTPENPATLMGGVFWVVVTPVPPSSLRLECTALAGSGRAALSIIVGDMTEEPLFSAVLNSDETLTLNSGVTIDSFDSELGGYDPQRVNVGFGGRPYALAGGHVASNSDIVLNANAVLFGDATPGPGHVVHNVATGSHISGSTTPALTPFAFPPITPPSVPSAGPFTLAPSTSLTLPPGNHGYGNFALERNSTLTVTGPATLVMDDFTGGKDSRLVINAANGPVTIFVQGNYNHISGFEAVPAPGSPMALAFMVQGGGDVLFPSAARVRGAYYVPNAAVTFASNCEAWGSFAGRRIDMSSSMRFHYDESLSKHWNTEGSQAGESLRQLSWQRGTVAPDLMRDRRDPFVILGLEQGDLPSPSEAWL
jgi:hypothetical protein